MISGMPPHGAMPLALAPVAARRLLVLDDDPVMRGLIAAVGEREGFSVHTHADSKAFLQDIDHWQPSHVTLDLLMPDMDGVEVLRGMAERCCPARVTIISSVETKLLESVRYLAQEHGLAVSGMLSKPFNHAALRALLRADSVATPVPMRSGEGMARMFRPDHLALRQALDQRQFVVHYQPHVRLSDGNLVGVEALVRWQHPQHGLVSPEWFIRELERSEEITCLTWQVLEQSLEWLTRAELPESVKLSVNLSPLDLATAALSERLIRHCRQLGIAPSRLVLELTETAALANRQAVLEQLARLRVQGFGLALDDFGTGYSSMLQLVQLPFDSLKIDKSFVMSMRNSRESHKVVEGIVNLARSLGLYCTAEGVESIEIARELRALGCEFAQGHGIARPMDADALQGWIAAWDAAEFVGGMQVARRLSLVGAHA